jgi:hypothetical protein
MAKSAPVRKFAIRKGRWGSVEYALGANKKREAEEFYNIDLIKIFGKTDGEKVRRRLMAIFEYVADHGYSPRMSPERDYIHGIKWEFSKKLIRFACFQDGKCWVLTHGFFKPGAKKKLGAWPPEHLDRADRIMAKHKARFRGH